MGWGDSKGTQRANSFGCVALGWDMADGEEGRIDIHQCRLTIRVVRKRMFAFLPAHAPARLYAPERVSKTAEAPTPAHPYPLRSFFPTLALTLYMRCHPWTSCITHYPVAAAPPTCSPSGTVRPHAARGVAGRGRGNLLLRRGCPGVCACPGTVVVHVCKCLAEAGLGG